MQDAFATALVSWPKHGVPPAPAGWIITTARNRAIDRLRRETVRGLREAGAVAEADEACSEEGEYEMRDDQLRLIFICCHPALGREAQIALTLRLLAGLSTAEIARAFLVAESTLAQRITRAKAKIRDARIPYRVPEPPDIPARLAAVLAVVYLVFNEGYLATGGEELTRADLSDEAIRLARLLLEQVPDEPEVAGLLALMLLTDARRSARTTADGKLVRLEDQDRSLWNAAKLAEGRALLAQCLRRDQPGPYQLQAAINAVHSDAPQAGATDWRQILAIYDQLLALSPGPVVALNRAVAVAEVAGPASALSIVDELGLPQYHLFHAVRADLLRRLGRNSDAACAYRTAIGLCGNATEREFLEQQYQKISSGPGSCA